MKLYFMIGLPTETDEDVRGIGATGGQAVQIGQQYHRRKVAGHGLRLDPRAQAAHAVPVVRQDTMDEIERKQALLRRDARRLGYTLKTHDHRVSHLEGIFARGDLRLASLIERACRKRRALRRLGRAPALGRLARGAGRVGERGRGLSRRLPRDSSRRRAAAVGPHRRRARTGLPRAGVPPRARGPLLAAVRQARSRQVHHTNLEDARADQRKLVCYDCGVACDMTEMREERLVFLERMGAETKPVAAEEPTLRERAQDRVARGLTPHDFSQGEPVRYRIHYGKTGPMSLRGHLDFIKVIARVLRRGRLPLFYTEGFSPRPLLSFGPALGLGLQSVAEYADVALTIEIEGAELLEPIHHRPPSRA